MYILYINMYSSCNIHNLLRFASLWPPCSNSSLHVNSLLMQVIIKQEPGEVSTQQQQMVSTVTSQQQPAATAAHQFVAVKGGHMISMSAQKQAGGATGATSSKVSLSCIYSHTLTQTHISHLHVTVIYKYVVKSYSQSKTMFGTSLISRC